MSSPMSWDEFYANIELGRNDPEEAIKRFYNRYAMPLVRKSQWPQLMLDPGEYRMVLSAQEKNDPTLCLFLLSNFLRLRSNKAPMPVAEIRNMKVNEQKNLKVNVWVKLKNVQVFPLNPMAKEDRVSGEYPDIEPGNEYEGMVFFPHLITWIQARLIALQGV